MNKFELLTDVIEEEINKDIKDYIQQKYGKILDIKEPNKIKVVHESYNMYSIYENDVWKLARHQPDNIFQALNDLGIIEFVDNDMGGEI